MHCIRVIIRLILLILWFVVMGLNAALSFLYSDRTKGIRRNSHLANVWAAGILKILNIKLEVCGKLPENLGSLFISNHLGYSDILIHGAMVGSRFAPKADIRKWPFLGPFIGLSFPVWVDRRNKIKSMETMEEFRLTLDLGVPLIVYPEGTSTDGLHGILPFKSTPFEAAVEAHAQVVPVITEYFPEPGCMNPAWYGDLDFLPHVYEFLGTRRLRARVTILDPIQPDGRDRKDLAEASRSVMVRAYNDLKGTSYE